MTGGHRKRFVRLTPLDDPAAFGPRLRSAREAAGFSLRELSFPGCSPSYISRLENGSRVPSLQLVHALAQRLGVRPEELLGTSTRPTPEDLLTDGEVALRLGELGAARECFREVVDRGEGDVRALGMGGLAQVLAREGESEEALELFEEARVILGPRFAQQPSLVRALGALRAMRSEFEEAIALFHDGRKAADVSGDKALSLRMTLLLANAYIDLGAVAESAEQLSLALKAADELGDGDLRARTLWSQSRLHTVEGRHDLAAGLARRALEALELSEDELSIAVAKQLLAYIELERGDANAALGLLREARPTVDRLGDAETRARFLLEEARALAGTGEPDAARELAIEVAPVLERTARVDAGRCFVVLGDLWVEFGEPDAATGAYDVAIAKLSGHRSPWLARAYKQKSALLEAGGDRDGALELLKRALDAEVDVSLHPRPA